MVHNLIFIAVVPLVVFLYLYVKKSFSYWSSRNVFQVEPSFPFGNLQGVGSKKHMMDIIRKIYEKYGGTRPFVGMYFFLQPVLMICNLELIKKILVADFNYFTDRGFYYNDEADPLSAHLFSIEGIRWKNLRTKLSPTFTSGKMKFMFDTVANVADKMTFEISAFVDKHDAVPIKELVARFTTDVIGEVAFGIECNSLRNPDSEFRAHTRKLFEPSMSQLMRIAFTSANPKLCKFFGVRLFPKTLTDFFFNATKDVVNYRRTSNSTQRKDFLQMLIDLEDKETAEKLSMNEIAAQAFLFFLAGSDTSSATISFCLYELALNQKLQDKVREEINNVLDEHDGKINYEAMIKLPFLEKCINETLRKYSVVESLLRIANKDYKIPGTDIIIEKGTRVAIPISGIHYDPNIYPDPELFDPERFNEENTAKRHPFAHVPFGEGPRVCIGMRFGLMQTKLGIVSILRKYRVQPSPGTPTKIVLHPKIPGNSPSEPIKLLVELL